MSKTLLILEAPSKAKKVQTFLSSDYIVKASVGHIRDIPVPKNMTPDQKKKYGDYGIDVSTPAFEPLYKNSSDKAKVIKELKGALAKVDSVILMTDDDNEGHAISWHLIEALNPKVPIYRAVTNEITKTGVDTALKNMVLVDTKKRTPKEFFGPANSALTRSAWDRLYGFATSPYVWKALKPGTALHEDTLIPTFSVTDVVVSEVPTSMWQKDLTLPYSREELFSSGGSNENFIFEDKVLLGKPGFKRLKDIKPGDIIVGSDGRPTKVLEKHEAFDRSYELTFDLGLKQRKVRASAGHLWDFETPGLHSGKPPTTKRRNNFGFSALSKQEFASWLAEAPEAFTCDFLVRFLQTQGCQYSSAGLAERVLKKATKLEAPRSKYCYSIEAVQKKIERQVFRFPEHRERTLLEARKLYSESKLDSGLFYAKGEVSTLLRRSLDSLRHDENSIGNWFGAGRKTTFLTKSMASVIFSELHESNKIPQDLTATARPTNQNGLRTFSTDEIFSLYQDKKFAQHRVSIPTTTTYYPEAALILDPYALGLWLGDGDSGGRNLACGLVSDLKEYQQLIPYSSSISTKRSKEPHLGELICEGIKDKLKTLGICRLSKDSHSMKKIPNQYLLSSVEQRTALIAGLVDTDGSVSPEGEICIYNTNYVLVEQIAQLLESLGYKPSVVEKWRDAPNKKVIFSVKWNYKPGDLLAKLSRKKSRLRTKGNISHPNVARRTLIDVKPITTDGRYFCLTVDSNDSLFLCDSFIATHNSSGRVQTPGARLVVERELERLAFTSVNYYSIQGIFDGIPAKLTEFDGVRVASGADLNEEGKLKPGRLLITNDNLEDILTALQKKDYSIGNIKQKPYRRSAPAPFMTSSALQSIGGKTGMSSKALTSIFQGLYQNGDVTYIRTVSVEAAPEAIAAARKSIESIYGKSYVSQPANSHKDKKQGNSGHECIRPTLDSKKELLQKSFPDTRVQKVFDLIRKRMLASQAIDCTGTTWTMIVNASDKKAVFSSSETEIEEPGWTTIYSVDDEDPNATT